MIGGNTKAGMVLITYLISVYVSAADKNTVLYQAPRLVMELNPEASTGEGLKKYKLNLFKGLLCKKSGITYESNYSSLCDQSAVTDGKIIFRCSASLQNQSTWEISLADKDDLVDANFMGFIYSNCYSEISNQKKLALKAKYEGAAITDQERGISKNWSDWDSNDVFLFEPGELVYYTENEIIFPQDEKNRSAYISAFEKFKRPQEDENAKRLEKAYQKDGYPLIDVYKACHDEQIHSMKQGVVLSSNWFPTKAKYDSGVHYYKIIASVGRSPVRLVLEAPGDMSSSIQGKCLLVVSVANKGFLGVPSPLIGESIGGFKLKSKGKISLEFKLLRSLSPVKLMLPELELIAPISQILK